jgi:hypothetical protein
VSTLVTHPPLQTCRHRPSGHETVQDKPRKEEASCWLQVASGSSCPWSGSGARNHNFANEHFVCIIPPSSMSLSLSHILWQSAHEHTHTHLQQTTLHAHTTHKTTHNTHRHTNAHLDNRLCWRWRHMRRRWVAGCRQLCGPVCHDDLLSAVLPCHHKHVSKIRHVRHTL